jgi:tRNA A-37 threonylcarbamoyl transferase component Bud32
MRLDLLEDGDLPVEFGRYRLLRVLGEGGMARVFEAELGGAEGFRKAVALKVVRGNETRRDPGLRRALVREARLGGLLRHPGIVDTYDFGEHDGQVYIAMELVRGQPLDDLLRARGSLPGDLVVHVARRVAEALEHAHAAEDGGEALHLVHRDLKPGNVLVGDDGSVKVADFGIAKAATLVGDTRTGETKGTPLYMSPEQLEGGALDGRSDLFALGAMIWEMALGERLHQAGSLPALVLATLRVDERLEEPGSLSPLERIVPGLGAVVAGCLRRDPAERYPSASAVVADLRAIEARLPPPDLRGWLAAGRPGAPSGSASPPVATTADALPPPPPRRAAIDVSATRAQTPPARGRWTGPAALAAGVALALLAFGAWRGASLRVERGPVEGARPGLRLEVGAAEPLLDAGGGAAEGPDAAGAASARPPGPSPEAGARPRSAAGAPTPDGAGGEAADGRRLRPGERAMAARAALRRARLGGRGDAAGDEAVDDEVGEDDGEEPEAVADPAPPASPLAIVFADYESLPGPGQGIRLRFVARTRCPDGCSVALHTLDARGDRQDVPMEGSGPQVSGRVTYPPSSAGHIKWWITATDPAGRTASYGSEARPEDAVVR